jgi:hypothetical protein
VCCIWEAPRVILNLVALQICHRGTCGAHESIILSQVYTTLQSVTDFGGMAPKKKAIVERPAIKSTGLLTFSNVYVLVTHFPPTETCAFDAVCRCGSSFIANALLDCSNVKDVCFSVGKEFWRATSCYDTIDDRWLRLSSWVCLSHPLSHCINFITSTAVLLKMKMMLVM